MIPEAPPLSARHWDVTVGNRDWFWFIICRHPGQNIFVWMMSKAAHFIVPKHVLKQRSLCSGTCDLRSSLLPWQSWPPRIHDVHTDISLLCTDSDSHDRTSGTKVHSLHIQCLCWKVGLDEPHLKYYVTPVSTGKVNEGQYPVKCQVLRINKSLFTNPAAILLPTLRAADVTLPAVGHGPVDRVAAVAAHQLGLQLRHQHQALVDNTAACKYRK